MKGEEITWYKTRMTTTDQGTAHHIEDGQINLETMTQTEVEVEAEQDLIDPTEETDLIDLIAGTILIDLRAGIDLIDMTAETSQIDLTDFHLEVEVSHRVKDQDLIQGIDLFLKTGQHKEDIQIIVVTPDLEILTMIIETIDGIMTTTEVTDGHMTKRRILDETELPLLVYAI